MTTIATNSNQDLIQPHAVWINAATILSGRMTNVPYASYYIFTMLLSLAESDGTFQGDLDHVIRSLQAAVLPNELPSSEECLAEHISALSKSGLVEVSGNPQTSVQQLRILNIEEFVAPSGYGDAE